VAHGANMPGNGGISRGRGDAELIWGEESQGRSEDFEAEVLPGARFMDIENTRLLGVGSAAPEVNAVGESGGHAAAAASSVKTAWRRRLSPHHRKAVGSFFTSETRKE